MEAAGVAVSWEGHGSDWRAAANAFEMMIGQFCKARGDRAVRDWVMRVFGPLVVVAKHTYDEERKKRKSVSVSLS